MNQNLLSLLFSGSSEEMIRYGGTALIMLMVFVETGLLVGVFVPGGGSLLFTAGLLAGSDLLPTPIYLLIPAVIAAATLGDLVGYLVGRKMGPYIEHQPDTWLFKHRHLNKARHFYQEHGLSAIVIGRFLPFIRTFNPLLAGITRMNFPHYISLCLTGTTVWVCALMGLSYMVGQQFPELKQNLGYLFAGIVVVSLLPAVFRYLGLLFHKSHA